MITHKLIELYSNNQERFVVVKDILKKHSLNGPYLSSPGELYLKQQNPLLIIGQETHGWKNKPDIQQQMKIYENFEVGKTYKRTPFWDVARKLEAALRHDCFSCAALNLNKFDVAGHKPTTEEQIGPIRELDNILVSEICIINPKVCIFLTSHNSDYRLRKIYPGLEIIPIDGWNTTQLCQLKHENLPKNSFRTYHPGRGWLKKNGL